MSRATVDRFVAWHRGVRMIEWTGIEKNANKMARILPVFKAFVKDNEAWLGETHGYKMHGPSAGQKGELYADFRDEILPEALREIRADADGKNADSLPPTMYLYKPTTLKSQEPSPRAIVGWEPRAPVTEPHEPEPPRKRRKSCPVHKKRWEVCGCVP